MIHEMCTGGFFPYQYDEPRSAYFELAPTEIYYRQRSGPPVDPRRRFAGLGDAWVDTLRAALDPDPRARPPSAGAFARMLAAAVSAGHGSDGHAILHRVARELTQRSSDGELRGSVPAPVLARDAGAEPSPEPAIEAQPVSTLAEAASQSLEASRGRRRWDLVAAAGLAALVAGRATAFAVTPEDRRARHQPRPDHHRPEDVVTRRAVLPATVKIFLAHDLSDLCERYDVMLRKLRALPARLQAIVTREQEPHRPGSMVWLSYETILTMDTMIARRESTCMGQGIVTPSILAREIEHYDRVCTHHSNVADAAEMLDEWMARRQPIGMEHGAFHPGSLYRAIQSLEAVEFAAARVRPASSR